MRTRTTSLARGGLTELCRAGLEATAFRQELRLRLARAIDFDAACINTVDPDSRLITSSVGDGLSTPSAKRLFELEAQGNDLNLLAGLTGPVSMHRTTEGAVWRSTRMREIFLPLGWRDELRAPLRVDGLCWGYLHLFRGRAFSSAEVALIAELELEIASALRAGCAIRETTGSSAVGVMTLDARRNLARVSTEARVWLDLLEGDVGGTTPHLVHVASLRARQGAVRAHHRTPGGAWLSLHATPLGRSTALVVGPAQARELAPLLFRAHGLTARERAVAKWLAEGHTNESIAAQLELRCHTVKDHVKAIFAKTHSAGRVDFVTRFA